MSDVSFEFLNSYQASPAEAPPPPFPLNDEQETAVEALREFLRDFREWGGALSPFFGLFGYAGTGKTTVIQRVFDAPDLRSLRVVMSAPTHKAVGVLSAMARGRGLGWVDFSTIHRLCGVKKHYRKGKIEYRPVHGNQMISGYDVVVIDECSMVSTEMWGWIREAIMDDNVAVILMGDPKQLPPVGERDSPTFAVEHTKLATVMRSSGVVLSAATDLRLSMGGGRLSLAGNSRDEHGEVCNLRRDLWLDALLEATKDGATNVKALAFTNRAVDATNEWLRDRILGKDAPPFAPGERLVLSSAYETQAATLLHTESELAVYSSTLTEHMGLPCYSLEVVGEWGENHEILTLDETQKPAWLEARREAKQRGKDHGEWPRFYRLEEGFAKVRPGWATTVHKSQGSTYESVFLNQGNVLTRSGGDPALTGRLLYVGYSRASHGLYLM